MTVVGPAPDGICVALALAGLADHIGEFKDLRISINDVATKPKEIQGRLSRGAKADWIKIQAGCNDYLKGISAVPAALAMAGLEDHIKTFTERNPTNINYIEKLTKDDFDRLGIYNTNVQNAIKKACRDYCQVGGRNWSELKKTFAEIAADVGMLSVKTTVLRGLINPVEGKTINYAAAGFVGVSLLLSAALVFVLCYRAFIKDDKKESTTALLEKLTNTGLVLFLLILIFDVIITGLGIASFS